MDENNLKEKAGFTLRGGELACALLMYPTAYIYTVFSVPEMTGSGSASSCCCS